MPNAMIISLSSFHSYTISWITMAINSENISEYLCYSLQECNKAEDLIENNRKSELDILKLFMLFLY
jgi:hypothetical protein